MVEKNNNVIRRPTRRISNIIFIFGIILLATALDYNSRVTALIGTNLILIGAVLSYSRPKKFIRNEVLVNTLSNHSLLVSRLVVYMGYIGEPMLFSPRSLWGLHNVVTIIPKNTIGKNIQVNETNEVYISEDFIQVPPSGIGLLKFIEHEFNINFTSLELINFGTKLDEILINGLDLVKKIEVNIAEDRVEVKLVKPISEAIIQDIIENNRIHYGDPILNSIGCMLAKITGKKIAIKNIDYDKFQGEVNTIYQLED
jgi:hypothetical protein